MDGIEFKRTLDDPNLSKEDLKLIYELVIEDKTNKTQIAKELQMSRQAIYKKIKKIKELGYHI